MLFYRWLIAAKASLDRTWPWRQWQWAFACSLIHDISSGCVYKSICNKKCRFCIQNIFTFIQADVLIASGKLNYPRINPPLPIFLHRRGVVIWPRRTVVSNYQNPSKISSLNFTIFFNQISADLLISVFGGCMCFIFKIRQNIACTWQFDEFLTASINSWF